MELPELHVTLSFPGNPARRPSRIDIGPRLADMTERGARTNLEALCANGPAYSRGFLSSAVPQGLRDDFRAGRAVFGDAAQAAGRFIKSMGGITGFAQWHALAREREARRRAMDRAARDLADVAAADFQTWETSGCDMLAHVDGDRFGDPGQLHDEGLAPVWRESLRGHADGIEQKSAEASRWARENSAPFAWATVPDRWEGVTAQTFIEARDCLLDDEPALDGQPSLAELARDVEEDIKDDLDQNHHEGAVDHVEDLQGIAAIAAAWMPLSREKDGGRATLDRMCAEWNAKQHIVSYLPTRKTVVGLYPDVTKDECVAFVRRKASEAAASLAETESLWRTPIVDRAAEAERLSSAGIEIVPSARDGWEVLSPTASPMRFPTFELAAEHGKRLAGLSGHERPDPVMAATREVTSGLMPVIASLQDTGDERRGTAPSHLLRLAREAVSRDGLTVDKVSRWLGFIQGVLVVRGHLDMDAERERTRPIFHDAYAKAGMAIPPTVAVSEGKP